MRTFSIKSLLIITLVCALLLVFLFTPFRFEYPVTDHGCLDEGKESLVLLLSVGDGIFEQVEVPEYELSDSGTHVVRQMTLAELVLFEWREPLYELNPDRPTRCFIH